MQVHCPSCSTAYEIPPPVRPRRLRCARCETEFRELPPAADAGPDAVPLDIPVVAPVAAPVAVEETGPPAIAPVPGPVAADAICATGSPPAASGALLWSVLWAASLLLIGGALFESWHVRGAIEHRWPESLWLFRLLPAGIAA